MITVKNIYTQQFLLIKTGKQINQTNILKNYFSLIDKVLWIMIKV